MKLRILLLLVCMSTVSYSQIGFGRGAKKKQNNELQINYSSPKKYVIEDIEVVGAEYLDPIALISISGLKKGDEVSIPGEDITSAIKKLWRQGLIGDIKIVSSKVDGDKIYLQIVLTERPRLSRFNFFGISKTQEGELSDVVTLVRGRVLTDAVLKNTELSIRNYFYEKGFVNAVINLEATRDSLLNNSVQLDIYIDRNRKVKVGNISFFGNTEFSDTKLKSKMKKTGERPRFHIFNALIQSVYGFIRRPKSAVINFAIDSLDNSVSTPTIDYLNDNVKLNFFKSSKYVIDDFEEDKASLISFYTSKGYRDAAIVGDDVVSVDENTVDINIYVNPGKKYYFRDISWEGNYIHDDETLASILNISKGDVYNLELVDKKLNYNPTGTDISSLYMDNGYLFFSVTPVEVKIDGDSVDVEMRVFEGIQADIKRVYVTGNDRTNDHVILREIRTLPGQKFDRSLLIRTQRELSQLGYFDPEKVAPNPIPSPNGESVDIEWSLVERASDQIELSGGWGGNFGFIGTLGLTFNNFSLRNVGNFDKWKPLPVGDGQKFSLRMQANGKQFQSYSLSFQEPWLGGSKPNSLGVSFNYSVQRNINPWNAEILGSITVAGFSVNLGRRLKWPDDYFTLSNALSFTQYSLINFGSTVFDDGSGTANNINLNTTFRRSSVDNPMYPRSGSDVTLSVALTPPYSLFNNVDYENASSDDKYRWIEYHKWMFDSKYYLRLLGDLVLETRMHFGYIGSYKNSTGLGPFERFQLGGDGLSGQNFILGNDNIGLRGYVNNSLTPNGSRDGSVLPNGTVYSKFVMEMRYPVSLNPTATIYVLSFLEAGNNWQEFKYVNPNRLYKSAGLGVRIFMPAFGLLGIDYGYGFDANEFFGETEPSGGQIHFSIGQTIR